MLILIHEKGRTVEKILLDGQRIDVESANLVDQFWYLTKKYALHTIIWVEKKYENYLNIKDLGSIFSQNNLMLSYAIESQFLPDSIGYIDQMPFVNPNYNIKYPSWRMSTDVGGIKGETAQKFFPIFKRINDFGYLLNSIAKIGQQNSIFCYSQPNLLHKRASLNFRTFDASISDFFKFVFQFYKTEWLFVLLFCYMKYERRFPLISFLKAFFNTKYFEKTEGVDLSDLLNNKISELDQEASLDVIIPTLKRPDYIEQTLKDLASQSFLPKKVIVIEQDPDPYGVSQLLKVTQQKWPFLIEHRFIHKVGACRARNMALELVSAKWIFFADDDIRLSENFLKFAMCEIHRLAIKSLNVNCLEEGCSTVFPKIKQWGAFASGSSIVAAEYAKKCVFRTEFEFGFGEDTDYGLQLRNNGLDIIYHPKVYITHLKAPRGGFREPIKKPWEVGNILPKPSPTMMLLVNSHFSEFMKKGYKIALFIKYYRRQTIKNPFVYIHVMKKRWQISEIWSRQIDSQTSLFDEI
ncbi:hypothetical protein C8P64_0031 [Christiangramia gaetbulicola]|uniref:Glycosyltransferase 2-like domain-containing protein n=1 Tax=Christiangramia gaetbulicola TaxID=703340 RepID=A0A2T6AJS7_9FLAO|nr:glycosyltransferase [Christiangramia gaetbulicola]PTX44061.1 hypothetical protein C8P64_0031 [Christiangramia gaetbulicola]